MQEHTTPWESTLKRLLPLWGHRNWIVIADSAYPAQANPGIDTIATETDHLEVLRITFDALQESKHVRPTIYLDAEFEFVSEADAPGISQFRQKLLRFFDDQQITVQQHNDIIARLDQSGKLFRVLVLKSTLTIPYSSVFLELDCGYWSSDSEKRLRQSMSEASNQRNGDSA
jgi:hypothetical protein